MLRNNVRIAWRTLSKSKYYSILNIAGLTFGLTCFMLIGLFIFDELTFDQQHSKGQNIYRLVENITKPNENILEAAGGYQIAEQAPKKIRGVVSAARMQRMGRANLVNPANPVNFQEDVTAADARFLQIFDFPLLAGNRNALSEPNTIVINEELAQRLFGTTDVLGQTGTV